MGDGGEENMSFQSNEEINDNLNFETEENDMDMVLT